MAYNNHVGSQRNRQVGGPRDPVIEEMQHQIDTLTRYIEVIEQRLTALETGGRPAGQPAYRPAEPPRAGAPAAPLPDERVYDRRNARQDLPEDRQDDPSRAPAPPPPPPASSGRAELDRLMGEMVELFAKANKPDFDALAARYNAESFTNERKGDLSQLIKSEIDRFWVVPVPGHPSVAVMIPGFNIKRTWAKFRQPETDHPLVHHFELRRGEWLHLIRPAVVVRNANGFWELKAKGEVSGVS